jgi:hypothetical protein
MYRHVIGIQSRLPMVAWRLAMAFRMNLFRGHHHTKGIFYAFDLKLSRLKGYT